jgi:hypothetical protein
MLFISVLGVEMILIPENFLGNASLGNEIALSLPT